MTTILQIKKSGLVVAFASVISICGLTSCGTSNDPGVNLGVSVSPEKAYVVPGKGVSCVAQATAKTADTAPTADIEGDRILFNHFKIQWRSPDALTIASIKLTIFSSGISGADTATGLEITLSEEETAALLGLANQTIGYANPYLGADGKPVSRTLDIDSTSTTIKSSTSVYAPCGLQIGTLTSPVGVKTYSARIKIEVLGFSSACDEKNTDGTCLSGLQTPVRQSVNVTAQKY